MVSLSLCVCFLFKQKTAYELRSSDWSLDVCSSDLGGRKQIATIALASDSGRGRKAAASQSNENTVSLRRRYFLCPKTHSGDLRRQIGSQVKTQEESSSPVKLALRAGNA